MLQVGIVGLPNVGKSTLFNVLTKAGAASANYPFCTIEPNVGTVAVPDPRLDILTNLAHTQRTVPAMVQFVDIAGLVKGASKGEGLGNQFLSHIREVDAIVHVCRAFEDENIIHVENSVDPIRDIEIINIELALADMSSCEKRIDRLRKTAKTSKVDALELETLELILPALNEAKPIRSVQLTKEQQESIKANFFLTSKPMLYLANVDEKTLQNPSSNKHVVRVQERAKSENSVVVMICAKLEEELIELSDEEVQEYLKELNVERGLDNLIRMSFGMLGLMTYFTVGEKEVRAWTIRKNTKAPQAAAEIHTDFERGFIKAEVIGYDDLVNCGSKAAAREKGLARMEGKEYVVKDGDIIEFRFNV